MASEGLCLAGKQEDGALRLRCGSHVPNAKQG